MKKPYVKPEVKNIEMTPDQISSIRKNMANISVIGSSHTKQNRKEGA